jgi:hypothetical protein
MVSVPESQNPVCPEVSGGRACARTPSLYAETDDPLNYIQVTHAQLTTWLAGVASDPATQPKPTPAARPQPKPKGESDGFWTHPEALLPNPL